MAKRTGALMTMQPYGVGWQRVSPLGHKHIHREQCYQLGCPMGCTDQQKFSSKGASPLYKAEFTTPPAMAKARPNLPMDSNTLAAMFPFAGPTHT